MAHSEEVRMRESVFGDPVGTTLSAAWKDGAGDRREGPWQTGGRDHGQRRGRGASRRKRGVGSISAGTHTHTYTHTLVSWAVKKGWGE